MTAPPYLSGDARLHRVKAGRRDAPIERAVVHCGVAVDKNAALVVPEVLPDSRGELVETRHEKVVIGLARGVKGRQAEGRQGLELHGHHGVHPHIIPAYHVHASQPTSKRV